MGMMIYIYNPNTQLIEAEDTEFKASLGYTASLTQQSQGLGR